MLCLQNYLYILYTSRLVYGQETSSINKCLWVAQISLETMAGMQFKIGQGKTKLIAKLLAARKYDLLIYDQFCNDCR